MVYVCYHIINDKIIAVTFMQFELTWLISFKGLRMPSSEGFFCHSVWGYTCNRGPKAIGQGLDILFANAQKEFYYSQTYSQWIYDLWI